jgi:tRNA U34 5-methylaminomethyl-2-thiouridine-forming methyltransferase MnmC
MSDNFIHPTRIILTDDGSNSLFSEKFKENYHSGFGAITESRHIFINNGLKWVTADPIHILEVGFGTGLNCLLTFLELFNSFRQVRYEAIEAYPINPALLYQLNYPSMLGEDAKEIYNSIISSNWDIEVSIKSTLKIRKITKKIEDFNFSTTYQLVYFDAFSPEIQPEMWSEAIFKKIYDSMSVDGILITYSCKGIVKRALKSVGFAIEKLAGPPGKREILMAKKI